MSRRRSLRAYSRFQIRSQCTRLNGFESLEGRQLLAVAQLGDIFPGTATSHPSEFVVVGDKAYFAAESAESGTELWETDGTVAGTKQVVDIRPGSEGSWPYYLNNVGGELYFFARPAASVEFSFWKLEGGTAVELESGLPTLPIERAAAGNTLYFSFGGSELWRLSDSRDGLTRLTTSDGSPPGLMSVRELTAVGNRVFFQGYTAAHGYELWVSDGTAEGTRLVRDIEQSPLGLGSSYPSSIIGFQGRAYFSAFTSSTGVELWTSDGTAAGTRILKEQLGAEHLYPTGLTVFGDAFYFAGNDYTGTELWRSDGTEAGTVRLKSIADTGDSTPDNFAASTDYLYFTATDAAGTELWKTDGTAMGTIRVRDIAVGSRSSLPLNLVPSGGGVVFTADDGVHGRELWVSMGTEDSTYMVANIQDDNPSATDIGSAPIIWSILNGRVLFTANEDIHGREPWVLSNFSPPIVVNPLEDQTVNESNPSTVLDIANRFRDIDSNELALQVTSSNPALVNATLVGNLLTLQFGPRDGNATVTVTATDPDGLSVSDAFQVTVRPTTIAASMSPIAELGAVTSIQLRVTNDLGIAHGGYRGTVRFTSSDPLAILPPDYAFSEADQGVHNFVDGVTLHTPGAQTITVTDVANGTIWDGRTLRSCNHSIC